MDTAVRALLSGGEWAARLARGAVPTLALLPPTCKQAAAHAALVCVGVEPAYFAPGFGPWPLAWGWFAVGVLLGAALVAGIWCAWASRQPAMPRSLAPELAAANEVLMAFHAGGEAELRALAAQAGTAPMEMLCGVLAAALGRPMHAPPSVAGIRRRQRPAVRSA